MSAPQHANDSARPRAGRRRGRLIAAGIALGAVASLAILGAAQLASEPVGAQAPGARETVVEAAGVSQHVACQGTGGPTVVIVNGLGADSSEWNDEMPSLAEKSRVCVVDRAGTGDSPQRQKNTNGPVENADELLAGLAAAGERGPYVFVGWSYGGVVSLVAAKDSVQSPSRDQLAGLVLVDPSLPEEYRTIDTHGWVEGGIPLNMSAGEAAVAQLKLGDVPVVVLEAGQPLPKPADEKYQHERLQALAEISTNSVFGTVPDSPHDIAAYSPRSIVTATSAVVDSYRRDNAPLGQCPCDFADNEIVCE